MISKDLQFISKNEGLNLCINNLISRCFISLYSEIVEIEVLRNIWDKFFLYGDLILFRTFKFIAYLLCDKKYENKKYSIEKIHEEILNKLKVIKDTDLLNYFLLMDPLINDSYIKISRKKKKMKIYQQNSDFKESLAENKTIICDVRTPYCVYNNEINDIEKYNEFKIFKIKNNTKYYQNYFIEKINGLEKEKNEEEKKLNNNEFNIKVLNENSKKKNEINLDDLDKILIERHKHVCVEN